MSWKCSRLYWSLGRCDLHAFYHALDYEQGKPNGGYRLYVTVGIGRREWWLWPLRRAEHRWHDHVMPGAPSRYEYDRKHGVSA